MDTVANIKARLEEKRASLAKLDRQRDTLLTEIRVFQEVLEMIGGKSAAEVAAADPATAVNATREAEARLVQAHSQHAVRPRPLKLRKGLSSHWKAILGFASARYPATFTYDDVVKFASLEGVIMTKAAARTKMMNFVGVNYVERVEDGIFRMTERGATVAGTRLGAPKEIPLQLHPVGAPTGDDDHDDGEVI